ncbi:ATP-binding cassette domain-containing protein [Clostridiaceae bacterium]|jgi:oligopeptide transport system ATP-binding protein|nr:ATP-binding cassette domain-containing protein [Clostridium sp.]NBI72658.1 ATP-binding cassette domain-containing protein [Clostridiaceae bacterium]
MSKQTARNEPLFQAEDLCQYFQIARGKTLKAVDHVNFTIYKGETLGLVGESGCGKSTTGRCLVKLYQPAAGRITYKGKDIFTYSREEEKQFRKNVQMIFQNPHSSLNPRMTVKDIVGAGMKLHGLATDQDLDAKVERMLRRVGLNRDHMSRFPHEFSGGQKQRIGIARALAVEPEFIICDEPISALDVSIQAQVLNMLKELQEELGLTYLFIAHDLSVVKYISDRVIVMYLGTMVEFADAQELYMNPLHPYTQVLLSSIPVADPRLVRERKRIMVKGEIPSPINPPDCCRFVERCPYAKEECKRKLPKLREVTKGHFVACHMVD